MPVFKLLLSIICFIGVTQQAFALPIGFGRNLEPLEYQELKSDHFWIYFDKRTPKEARSIINALEAGKPVIEHWLGEHRKKPLPVIMSATTDHASFANFITDALELQTLGNGGRDLAWHELTHNIMYRHLSNIFGPTGSILHLPWLPAWWIEGLAEIGSRSVGSDWMFSVERYYALTETWPSYDKLHSLYRADFANVGYSISGSFTDYIVRTYGADKLGQLMRDFYKYSMPWWWPWSVVPFADFMPWDAALRNYTGKNGAELYEEYKAAARTHWLNADIGPFNIYDGSTAVNFETPDDERQNEMIIEAPGLSPRFSSVYDLDVRGHQTFAVKRVGKRLFEFELQYSEKGEITTWQPTWELPADSLVIRATFGPLKIGVKRDLDNDLERSNHIWAYNDQVQDHRIALTRSSSIQQIFISRTHILWLEREFEYHRLCQIPIGTALEFNLQKSMAQVQCPLEVSYPSRLDFIGQHYEQVQANGFITDQVFLRLDVETLVGDRSKILRWSTQENQAKELANPLGGKVISLAKNDRGYDLLLAGKSRRFIRHLSHDGLCIRQRKFADLSVNLQTEKNGTYIQSNWYANFYVIRKFSPELLPEEACQLSDLPISPLHYALTTKSMDFQQALNITNPWQPSPQAFIIKHAEALQTAADLSQASPPGQEENEAQDAQWRGRPVFVFPWIGADAKGYQFGAISVPLMDHMQNETLRFSALYGLESRFPNTELNFLSNRFKTTYGVDVFRRQTWNGTDGRGNTYYFDERGAKVSGYRYFYRQQLSLRLGLKISELRPYIGPSLIWDNFLNKGYHQEIDFSLSQGHRLPLGSIGYYLMGAITPEEINNNFIYDRLGLGLNYHLPVSLFGLQSSQKLGVAYSRTRGKERKLLKEVYRPLKTFIPGSGGGFNEINVSMTGPGALTSAVYGDTQARVEFAWNFPLVRDLETLLHIFYLERLDFTAFFNYGRAWFGDEIPDLSQFVKAHGYNLDLQSDIKGVTVNLGVGTGQVIGQKFELYFLFGFDALIDP